MADPMDSFSEELQSGLSTVSGDEGRFSTQKRASSCSSS